MEVEVKLRLPTAESHQRVADLLAEHRKAMHMQENIFFDGADGELSTRRVVLRLRFYNGDARCVITLKGQAVITDGVSRADELEHDLDPVLGRACVADPSTLSQISDQSSIISKVLADFGCPRGFVCLRGFRNVRNVFHWRDLEIELDETQFDFGTQYEIECETDDPDRVKKDIEEFLRQNGVPFQDSRVSKFAIFRSGKLPD